MFSRVLYNAYCRCVLRGNCPNSDDPSQGRWLHGNTNQCIYITTISPTTASVNTVEEVIDLFLVHVIQKHAIVANVLFLGERDTIGAFSFLLCVFVFCLEQFIICCSVCELMFLILYILSNVIKSFEYSWYIFL